MRLAVEDRFVCKQYWEPPSLPVVYFLLLDGDVVYIGQAMDLRARISSHRKLGRVPFNAIHYFSADLKDISILELDMIRKYQPKYNTAGTENVGGRDPRTHMLTHFDEDVEADSRMEAAAVMGRKGGKKGGPIGGRNRARVLSSERRSEIAALGGKARWRNRSDTEC